MCVRGGDMYRMCSGYHYWLTSEPMIFSFIPDLQDQAGLGFRSSC